MTDFKSLNGKTILVTGGAGYIGSHTILSLLENSACNIVSVDNYYNSTDGTYERIKNISGKSIDFFELDLADKTAADIFFEKNKIDAVIHFAAYKTVPESVEKPLLYYRNNINSLLNMLENVAKYDIKNFIFSSSCSVYGNIKTQPVTEETPLNKAESPYGHTKQIGEEMIENFAKIHSEKKFISLRYFNPVGAHPSGKIGEIQTYLNNLVPIITKTAIGEKKSFKVFGTDYETPDGTCVRDYVHVSDIAKAHVQALNLLLQGKQNNPTEIFNLGSGKGSSVLELIKTFEESTGVKLNYELAPRRPGDVAAIYANNDKAKSILGWQPEFSLKDMMTTAWKWEKYLNAEL